MPYGLAVYNTSGALIISETYQNYHIVSSGTSANGAAWPTYNYNNGELLYIRAGTAGATVSGGNNSTGNFTPTVIISSGVMEWVVVKRSPSPATASFGLRVYQSDGASVAFDSAARAIKVVSSVTRTQATDGTLSAFSQAVNQPFAVPSGRKRYIGANSAELKGFYLFNTGFGFIPYAIWGDVLWTSDMQQTPSNAAGQRDAKGTETYLFVDV